MPSGSVKTGLAKRLDAVQAEIDKQAALDALVKAATEATVKAEGRCCRKMLIVLVDSSTNFLREM